MNVPSGPVSTRWDAFVFVLVIVTAAFATGVPDGDVTVPERVPPVTCAYMIGTQVKRRYTRSFENLLDMKFYLKTPK